jgi:hypothetical protein
MRRGVSGPSKTPPPATAVDKHDHEWRLRNGNNPIIEDGAAVFFEECDWVEITGSTHSEKHDETFHSYGADCEATRSWRMESSSIIRKRDDEPNIEFVLDSEKPPAERGAAWLLPHLIAVESSGEITMCDPEKIGGSVRVETEEWAVLYEAGYDS